MSYILDALRKSEKERRRGEVPGVLSQQDAPYPIRKRRSPWPYVILAPIVINIVVLLWVFNPWQQKTPPPPTPQTAPAREPAPTETGKTRGEAAGQGDQELRKSSPDAPAGTPQAPDQEKKEPTRREVSSKRPPDPASGSDSASAGPPQRTRPVQRETPENKAPQEIPPPAPNRTYSLAELPQGLKQKLPALSLALTVHSDDRASRLATVNGQTVREGQMVSEGVRVEEILPDSVVFTFQGYRFRLQMR
jgi:general secretion pathway protein B